MSKFKKGICGWIYPTNGNLIIQCLVFAMVNLYTKYEMFNFHIVEGLDLKGP